MKPFNEHIAIEGRNIVKDFQAGNTTVNVLKNISLQVFQGSVEENIMLPLLLDGKKMGDYKKELKDMLEMVGLSDRQKATPRKLSGG